jgi:hypothetical protein
LESWKKNKYFENHDIIINGVEEDETNIFEDWL